MSLPVPQLDDLDFERLFEEARALIPRYAPEWTDHNLHDPGITLLDLIAWLVDQDVYQIGFVSDRHIEAFAALLGIRPELTKPARGLVWPHDRSVINDTETGVDLDAGANVACVEQPDLPFELAAAVHISPAQLVDRPAQHTSERFEITAQTASRQAALLVKETNDAPGIIELVFDRPLVEGDANESAHPIAVGIELEEDKRLCTVPDMQHGFLIVDYRLEREGAPWRRVEVAEDSTYVLNHTGTVRVRIPPDPFLAGANKIPSRLRLSVRGRVNPCPPRIVRIALNVMPIAQLETHAPALLGWSNGWPDQVLKPEPPLEGLIEHLGIQIEVEEDGRFVCWKATEDLSQAEPNDKVFEPRLISNEIVFGNGVNGQIPPVGAQIRHLGYKLSKGDTGNLTAGLNWRVSGAPSRIGLSSYGINHAAITCGKDASDIDYLRAEARKAALERQVLLTNADLEKAARGLEGLAIERAEVSVGLHPALPCRKLPGTRALIVTPARPADIDPLTPVSRRYLAAIERELMPRRVLGERLSILATRRVAISVKAQLLIDDGRDPAEVIEIASSRLNARLSDIADKNSDLKPWPVGRPVTREEMKALLAGVIGVIAVPWCQLARGEADHQDQDLTLAPDEIAIGQSHDINTKLVGELGLCPSNLPAKHVAVSVKVQLTIEDDRDRDHVIEMVTVRLNARLSETADEKSGIKPWPLGRAVTRDEMRALLTDLSGVIEVSSCQLARGEVDHQDKDLTLAPDEIAIGRGHEIRVIVGRKEQG